MSNIAIRVNKIGKQYHIGKAMERYPTLRSKLANSAVAPFRRARKLLRGQATGAAELDEKIWALKDVSFEAQRTEVVGIIGRNGAGKSTLLKILSRITEPTEGSAMIYGRVGSLLEVGTGFHQELTGRENVYLNGAILGMKRAEIDRKFDEIVAFSEVEKFIDTPVKHYSSGMSLRLAFAVAAHLEPEILIIDEVLAVGDIRFQRKCLNKMQDVGQQGRTILFVSHNMPAVTRLCERAILLDEGRIIEDGPVHQVVGAYLNSGMGTTAARSWSDLTTAPGNDVVRLCAVRIRTEDGQTTDAMDIREPIGLEMEYAVLQSGQMMFPYFTVFNEEGVRVFSAIDQDQTWREQPRSIGHYTSTAWIPGNLLSEGTLFVGAAMRTPEPKIRHFNERETIAFQVIDSLDGDSARGNFGGRMSGVVRPLLEWETQFSLNGSKVTVAIGSNEVQ
jgi:lipopolysaccharide transport system ATP-binding protein